MEICWPCWNSRESWVCYDGFPQNPLVRHNFPTFSPLKLQVFHLCPIFSQFFSDVFNMFTIDIAMFPSFPLLLQYFPCWNGSFFHLCPRSSHTSSYFYIIYIYICMYIISIYIYIHIYFYILYIYIYTHIYISHVCLDSIWPIERLLVPQISEGFLWAPGSICCSCWSRAPSRMNRCESTCAQCSRHRPKRWSF